EILYLGSDDGLESTLAPAAGFSFTMIKAGKLRRYVSVRTLTGVARVPVGMAQAITIVRKFRPQVALTSGGYVAVPAGLAARLNGVPLVMHQQDVPPNLSNRLLAPMATRISVAFADSLKYFPPRKTLHLGNPVRQAILDIRHVSEQEARQQLGMAPERPLLLVTGGSQGARHLNQVVCAALPNLLEHCSVLQITGTKLFEETQTLSAQTLANLDESLKQRYKLVPYLNEEMPAALQAATIVLCRAGASTLSELAILGKPGILVPLPPTIGSSPQEANAAMFGSSHAAYVIRDAELQPEMLVERVIQSLSSPSALAAMAKEALAFAMPDATQKIVDTVVQIAGVQKRETPTYEGLIV
ncbi:MAG: UDP-N-acetylglucosamine--N-acetylmuramyl-(pentapeptide) pyrophosphoryl-undecaprenol N-acetylglucosamine transferase, partial [Chloroflexota bacterium]|nr:UDP-N-acetylglucosamine--N-acetylmuramyl-(pentapeptide) pyrophosphoryl-undecaprenol N-acetylglucosamine transferase [Chloroflexota bacterium]